MSAKQSLLPRDKHDIERVNNINNISEKDLVLLIPDLIIWIQDMNWPIAFEISKLLLKVPEQTIPHVKDVLATNDHIWKYWCLEYLVKYFPVDLIKALEPELNRIANHPSRGEEIEEVHEAAQKILEKLK